MRSVVLLVLLDGIDEVADKAVALESGSNYRKMASFIKCFLSVMKVEML
ncbi:MAG: hypothetical protein AAGJ08_25230 [Cyanobacteria bacterium P01_H01_bin.35]